MRSLRVPAVSLMALVLLGTQTGTTTAATSIGISAPASRIVDQQPSAPPTPPVTTVAFTASPCPVEVSLPDRSEGGGYICGTVAVPQRHADPAGSQLQLAVLRIMSTSAERRADPVVFLPGEAGEAGLDLAAAAVELTAGFPDHDLILFDQRGTGHSVPFLRCDEVAQVDLAALTGQTSAADALTGAAGGYAACAARFAQAGYDLSAFNTLESAADVRDVVTALGYPEYDLVATEHGTRIAQALLRDVPMGLRSVVLDSVEPAAQTTLPLRARTFHDAFLSLVGACAEDEACTTSHPDLEQTLLDTASRLSAEPARVPVAHGDATADVLVTGPGFLEAVAGRFEGDAASIDAIPAFIARAAGGDLTEVAASLLARRTDTGRADGLYHAVRCAEDQPGATEYVLDGVPEPLHPLAGLVGDRNILLEICAAMGITDLGGTVHEPATSEIPVLTLSGEFDPFTPERYADDVRATLAGSFGLEIPGVGQGVLLSAACPAQVAATFIAGPGQEPDASCIAEMPEFGTTAAASSAEPSTSPEGSPAPNATPEPSPSPRQAKAPKVKPVRVGLVKVAEGFENANGVTNAGDERLFVTEQEGYVEVLKPRSDGTFRRAGKFLDIRSRVVCCGEKGFLGIAFPPDYAQTGYFYVTFAGTGHTWNLEERRVSKDDPDRADPNYKRRLIRVYKPLDYHWAGDMHFGADGYLYVTVGDGGFGGRTGDPGDPANRAQDLGVIFGKMLRIDPRGSRKDGERYRVPRSNPFVGQKGAQPEIWAYGLRNPWRWSFDRLTNAMWIGDVGMWRYEEVNRTKAPNAGKGDNFGWRRMEGPVCYNPARRCDNGKLTLPYAWYGHQNGNCAVVAGYVYRGTRYPALRSWFVFGDYCSGRVMLLDSAGKTGQKPRVALDTDTQISAFGEGVDGELYLVDYGAGNSLYRVTGKRR